MSPWNAAGPPLCSPYLSQSRARRFPCLVYFVVYVVYFVVYCILSTVSNTPLDIRRHPHYLPAFARHSSIWPVYQIGPTVSCTLGGGMLVHRLRAMYVRTVFGV